MGKRLIPCGDGLWIAEGTLVDFYSFPYPTRMVVVRLAERNLWVWSPIRLDLQLRDEVGEIGTPAHLVSPNKIHHLFMGEWKAAYPAAKLWGLPAVALKRRDLDFSGILDEEAPQAWKAQIHQVIFRGSFFMDEAVLLHRESRTAIFGDLIENFSPQFLGETPGWQGWRTTIAHWEGITEPNGMAPLEWRLSFIRRRPARNALNRVLGWNPTAVVIAHGTCVHSEGRAFIERSFRWLR